MMRSPVAVLRHALWLGAWTGLLHSPFTDPPLRAPQPPFPLMGSPRALDGHLVHLAAPGRDSLSADGHMTSSSKLTLIPAHEQVEEGRAFADVRVQTMSFPTPGGVIFWRPKSGVVTSLGNFSDAAGPIVNYNILLAALSQDPSFRWPPDKHLHLDGERRRRRCPL